jgi:hypothetical protein
MAVAEDEEPRGGVIFRGPLDDPAKFLCGFVTLCVRVLT